MDRRGFTLVEVILVVAILSLLVLVLVPNIFVMIEKNNVKSCNSLKNNIESAAKMYVANNRYTLGFECGEEITVSFQKLVESGDLKLEGEGIVNPIDDTIIDLTNVVRVTYNCNIKEFDFVVDGINCEIE